MTGENALKACGGFGGREFSAKGREIRVKSQRTEHPDGTVSYSMGFPFATLSDDVDERTAVDLAEYLSRSPVCEDARTEAFGEAAKEAEQWGNIGRKVAAAIRALAKALPSPPGGGK